MQFDPLSLDGAFIITPPIFHDERGHFTITYQEKAFAEHGLSTDWVQDNQSFSQQGVVRGFHFQMPPHTEAKLIRVLHGEIMDVIVDLRTQSATFGQWHQVTLSVENRQMLYVPRGFGHGFCVMSEAAVVSYKVDNHYTPQAGAGILWDDPTLNVPWPVDAPILSDKDQQLPKFNDFRSPF
jgi:dTDP-4-dehydrorhamnose 3,5-epimerase